MPSHLSDEVWFTCWESNSASGAGTPAFIDHYNHRTFSQGKYGMSFTGQGNQLSVYLRCIPLAKDHTVFRYANKSEVELPTVEEWDGLKHLLLICMCKPPHLLHMISPQNLML